MNTAEIMALVSDKQTAVNLMLKIKQVYNETPMRDRFKLAPMIYKAFSDLNIGDCVTCNENTANAVISKLEKKSKIEFV